MKAALILATQQFAEHPSYADDEIDEFLFIESAPRWRKLPYHQHKIVLLTSAMRHTAARLEADGKTVRRIELGDELTFKAGLEHLLKKHRVTELQWMSDPNRPVDERIAAICAAHDVETDVLSDGLFLTPEEEVDGWFAEHPTPLMEDFYHWQRRRTGILMDGGKPAGRRWNFDADNRKPLPKKGVEIPPLPKLEHDEITRGVIAEVDELFPDHPGKAEEFWLPVTPEDSRDWLDVFVAERLHDFGRYEDAMKADEPFLFHAIISPMLNIGLLTVEEVVAAATRTDAPLASVEGFIRQVIGWREYMRGMYRAHPKLEHVNALHLEKRVQKYWYSGERMPSDLPIPVRTVLERVHRWGYAHHIERLMVLGNWFLLEGYAPRQVNAWFLALFVDAYDWVMVPNVMGMSQFADGGFVATKPYVSGGAYLQKMGSWWPSAQDAKDSAFTEAYWAFLERHEDVLAGNHRLGLALAQMRKRRDARE
ncbi:MULTISPECIES: cryptochrome/photolyase family protein [Microbacterium]|uniref:cryptochrome/photolyase family protein n=1 Tax=Microbacterium TaxID=33882 RepID=UPI0027882E8A|nr:MULTISPECIES: cryptochrome/photolyase family protein [Microbacterium]MDQ1083686.1 deoxyribodipyrimidine photolyase-related protein [Microbacterium sp. SORGH_AS_0344]MDQ1171037.1 deoxyribodipyrimidine photolyase-related protein [Microbacterium proteolyticum]